MIDEKGRCLLRRHAGRRLLLTCKIRHHGDDLRASRDCGVALTFLKAHHFALKCRNLHGIGSICTNGCLEAHGFVDKVNLSWPNGPCTGAL